MKTSHNNTRRQAAGALAIAKKSGSTIYVSPSHLVSPSGQRATVYAVTTAPKVVEKMPPCEPSCDCAKQARSEALAELDK